MFSHCESFNILEHECLGVQLSNETHEISDEFISWIVENTLTNQRKPLAWCAAEDTIDRLTVYSG